MDSVTNGQLRDQLVVGLRNHEIRKELLKEAKLTLAQALSKAVAVEASIADSSLYEESHPGSSADPLPSAVNRVSQSSPITKGRSFKCKYCGRQHARGKQHCPAADAQCTNCKKNGHFSSVCFQKKKSVARAIQEEEDMSDACRRTAEPHIRQCMLQETSGRHSDTFATTLIVNGKQCKGLLDTGATRTIITEDIVAASRPSSTTLKAYDGNTVMTLGVADVTIKAGDKSCDCTCFVVPARRAVLFGQDAITKLQLLSPTEVNMVTIKPVDIVVDRKAIPVALPPRRHAFSLRASIAAELKRLQENDIFEPVKEATPWVSPLVPVRKANGTLRLYVDYRRLNKSIVRERHMLPTVDEITAMLEGAKVFSVLDAESGFHQVPLSTESKPYTTFASHCGLFRFKRLPFGIACAPEIFQRVVSDILRGLEGVMVYIDDILIFGRNQKEHDQRIDRALQRLSNTNLKLNWTKCQIRQSRVKYLGHWLSDQGILPDRDKMQAIQDMPHQESVTDVRRFLGMATYLGKFIPQLSQITASLRQLTKRDPFAVDEELLHAFSGAKKGITSALQKLSYFQSDSSVPTAISSDASPRGLGAMLWQQDRRPVGSCGLR